MEVGVTLVILTEAGRLMQGICPDFMAIIGTPSWFKR